MNVFTSDGSFLSKFKKKEGDADEEKRKAQEALARYVQFATRPSWGDVPPCLSAPSLQLARSLCALSGR